MFNKCLMIFLLVSDVSLNWRFTEIWIPIIVYQMVKFIINQFYTHADWKINTFLGGLQVQLSIWNTSINKQDLHLTKIPEKLITIRARRGIEGLK